MQYKEEVSKVYSKLSTEDQRRLHSLMLSGDTNARDELISSCLPLVIKIAEKFSVNNKHVDIEDFIQEGNIALINAIDKWNPDISKSITTLAYHSITNALINMIQKSKYKIKTPYNITAYAAKIISKIESVESDDPKIIAKETGLSLNKVKNLMSHRYSRQPMYKDSVRNQIKEVDTSPDYRCLGYVVELVDKNIEEPNASIFKHFYGLAGRNKKSVQLGVEYNMSVKEIVSIINKTRTRVSKLAKEEEGDA